MLIYALGLACSKGLKYIYLHMPVGLPKVPFRLPGEENAVWVDVYITGKKNDLWKNTHLFYERDVYISLIFF
jgi:hypothetical protein